MLALALIGAGCMAQGKSEAGSSKPEVKTDTVAKPAKKNSRLTPISFTTSPWNLPGMISC